MKINRNNIIVKAVLFAAFVLAIGAAPPDPKTKWTSGENDNDRTTHIYCDGPLGYDTDKGVLLFNKNVVATRNGMKIDADQVEVTIDKKTKVVQKIVAKGAPGDRVDIVLVQKNVAPRRALAKAAVYVVTNTDKPIAEQQEILTLTSPGEQVEIYHDNVVLRADKVVIDVKTSIIIPEGNIHLENIK